jgi:hypothetical protein
MQQIVNPQHLQALTIHGSQLYCALFITLHRQELKITVQLVSAERQHLIQLWQLS